MDRLSISQEKSGRSLILWSVMASALLALLKISVGVVAHSTAVVSDGCEAAADVLSSVIVFLGLQVAQRPPDANHPYGHGRYETLSGLAVGGILVLSGCAICAYSLMTLNRPEELHAFAIYPLLLGILVKLSFAGLKWRAAKRLGSSALAAEAWHDLTDLCSTFVALLAVSLSIIGLPGVERADHWGGVAISFLVIYVGIRVVARTVNQLTDAMPDEESMRQIREAALSVPGALGIEKCFARTTGFKQHVDLHLEVDPDLTVRESHYIGKLVKERIRERLNWVADVLVHVEPSPGIPTDYAVPGQETRVSP